MEVTYLQAKPESDEGPFLKEARHPSDVIAERLGVQRAWELVRRGSTRNPTGAYHNRNSSLLFR